jgi:hypothetical protein
MLARGYEGGVRTMYMYEPGAMEVGFLALVIMAPLAARIMA